VTPAEEEAFIRAHTQPSRAPLVPEFLLHLATEITPIWQATEDWLAQHNIPPPFWAFAWPGGQALARFILDNPERVAGRCVLDFAAGCGIAALAAARAGASLVEAAEIDPLAIAAISLNARENSISLRCLAQDMVGTASRWDLILCGDICYEAPMARHILPWLIEMARNSEVLIADPGRAYRPTRDIRLIASYDIPTTLELEDNIVRNTMIHRLEP